MLLLTSIFPRARHHGHLNMKLGVIVALLLGLSSAGYVHYQRVMPEDAVQTAAANRSVGEGGQHEQTPGAAYLATHAEKTVVGRDGEQISKDDQRIHRTEAPETSTGRSAVLSLQSADRRADEGISDDEAVQDHGELAGDNEHQVSERTESRPVVDQVIHITNVGDRIVVSNDPTGIIADTATQPLHSNSADINQDLDVTTGTDAEPPNQLADYEELYPGCPRVLPIGSDTQMAMERQQLYGCRYLESCDTATEEQAASCIWHLVGKT